RKLANIFVPLDHFPVNSLTSKVFSFMIKKGKHFSGKVTPLFDTMLVQPAHDEGASSERLSVEQTSPSPSPTGEIPNESLPDSSSAQPIEVPFEQQPEPSPKPSPRSSPTPSPTPIVPDSIPEPSGENLGDHSSNDKSLSGNEDAMTLQNVYDLCITLCKQVSAQAKEIKLLKAKITKLKKKATPIIKHFKAYQKRISKEQRQQMKNLSKKKRVQQESVSKQGRKNAKGDGKAKENAQSKGRTKEMMDEDKENDEVGLSTKDEVSTAKEGVSTDFERVSTDFEKVSTDRPKLSTDDLKVSTDKQMESTDDQVDATEEIFEGTKDQKEGIEEKVESTADSKKVSTEEQSKEEISSQASQTSSLTPTSVIFGDDETIATLLINMSKAKTASKEKEKAPNESLHDSSSAQSSEVPFEQQPDLSPSPSPRPSPNPSPTPNIPDSIPEHTGENLGDHSFNDTSLSGNEDAMTLQNVYDLCISLCKQVSDQAKEIKLLKAKITKLKKKANPVIKHFKAYQKRISKEQRQQRKHLSKKKKVQIESVSKQGRKNAKGDGKAKENAQSEGRTKEMMDEDKETDEVGLSTEDEVSTAKKGVSTDFEKVSTDRPKLSTDDLKVSTDEQMESNDDQVDASEEIFEGTEDQREGIEEKVESTADKKVSTEEQSKEEIASQASQTSSLTPTSVIFGDDETIATLLINMSKAKAISKEKEKGVELKDVEDTDRPKTTSTRSTLTLKPLPKIDPKDKGKKKIEEEDETESEDDDIPQVVKKFKQLENDEELARKVQEEWEAEEEKNKIAEEEAANEALIKNFDDVKARIEADRILAEKLQEQEREQFTIEERAKFLHDTIAAQRKFLAQKRSQALRNKPPTKNQLRNQMITYLKHVGNFKHSNLKSRKFEDIQALYKNIKRFNEHFISTGSAKDERFIKQLNKKRSGF
ncbi:hypothetical protein Tco_0356842, partial [Tanacetum coccineum]